MLIVEMVAGWSGDNKSNNTRTDCGCHRMEKVVDVGVGEDMDEDEDVSVGVVIERLMK